MYVNFQTANDFTKLQVHVVRLTKITIQSSQDRKHKEKTRHPTNRGVFI